jgi:2-polyprenyl-3-methyl-5-hydroxy-6-metoxy-1,4-benzoquinol methylase
MKNLDKCDLCNGTEFEFLHKTYDHQFDINQEYSLNKCKRCGLIFINPQPSYKELAKHYSKDKYHSSQNTQLLNRDIISYKIYDTGKRNIIKKILFYPIRMTKRSSKIIPGGKILDVGCGAGNFLALMKQFGMECYGVDPQSPNESFAKKYGLNISQKDLKEAHYPDNFFDVITMNHVFEHVSNPTDTLDEIHRILKNDCTLILAVPNTNSFCFKIFGKDWVSLDPPRHLFDYNPEVIKKYAKKTGFKVESIRFNSTHFQFMGSLLYWSNRFRNKKVYLSDSNSSILFTKFMAIILIIPALILNIFRIGDQFEIRLKRIDSL